MKSGQLWWRWVGANAVGELAGLGLVAAIGASIVTQIGEPQDMGAILGFAALFVALGLLEGLIVGAAQAQVLRAFFQRRAWIAATVLGAALAWTLGMIPSTAMALAAGPAAEAQMAEPPALVQLALAVGLGAVAGAVLALPQWRLMRRTVGDAGSWIAANALGWMGGMPIIFAGIDFAMGAEGIARMLIGGGTLLAAGAVVGAIEGVFLVRLLRPRAISQGAMQA
jgi:hypothetical protein